MNIHFRKFVHAFLSRNRNIYFFHQDSGSTNTAGEYLLAMMSVMSFSLKIGDRAFSESFYKFINSSNNLDESRYTNLDSFRRISTELQQAILETKTTLRLKIRIYGSLSNFLFRLPLFSLIFLSILTRLLPIRLFISLGDAFRFTKRRPDNLYLVSEFFQGFFKTRDTKNEILLFPCQKRLLNSRNLGGDSLIYYDATRFLKIAELVKTLPNLKNSKLILIHIDDQGRLQRRYFSEVNELKLKEIKFSLDPIELPISLEILSCMSEASAVISNSDLGTVAGIFQPNLDVIQVSEYHTLPRNWIRVPRNTSS